MSRRFWNGMQGSLHDSFNLSGRDLFRTTATRCLFEQRCGTALAKTVAPQNHRGSTSLKLVGNLSVGQASSRCQNNPRLMQLVMEEKAERLVGPRHQQAEQRSGYRWGNEAGYCVVDGQKAPIERIRLRRKNGRELPLGSHQLFQRSAPLEDGVW